MTEAEQAALTLIDEQQPMLVTLHNANAAKDAEIASLNAQIAAFQQPSDAVAAVAQRKEWFDSFRAAAAPAPAEQPAIDPATGQPVA